MWDALETVFTGDQAEAKINDEQVKNAASYLEQMGYDLVGMGFVKTEYNTTNKMRENRGISGITKMESL